MGLWSTVKDLLGEKQEKSPSEDPLSNSSSLPPFSLQDIRRRAGDSQLLLRAQWICESKQVLWAQETQGTIRATIQSQSERNKKYEVTLAQDLTGTCGCPAWEESSDRFCKHLAAAALFVLQKNASSSPPVRSHSPAKAPANIRAQRRGIFEHSVTNTPLAVIDFETTGLSPGVDRVVEVSIVRIEPKQTPCLVLDTLVNPNRRVAATEIHGITDNDVKDAPHFEDIAGEIARALSGCVVGAYNVYFDIGFLDYELRKVGLNYLPPHLCLMYLRPMLGLGTRCSLDDACRAHGIHYATAHVAAADALAAARLWDVYVQAMADRRVRTFGDLARLKTYKFVQSFEYDPLHPTVVSGLRSNGVFKSRSNTIASSANPQRDAQHEYWEALKVVLSDLKVTDEEVAYLAVKKQELGLSTESLRSLHARAFASMISQSIDDKELDDQECEVLRRLHWCLSKLGWAPGE